MQENVMTYDEIAKLAEDLSYRDKFRLAQLLIQVGRKEEEEQYPDARKAATPSGEDLMDYVYARLVKLKPSKNLPKFRNRRCRTFLCLLFTLLSRL